MEDQNQYENTEGNSDGGRQTDADSLNHSYSYGQEAASDTDAEADGRQTASAESHAYSYGQGSSEASVQGQDNSQTDAYGQFAGQYQQSDLYPQGGSCQQAYQQGDPYPQTDPYQQGGSYPQGDPYQQGGPYPQTDPYQQGGTYPQTDSYQQAGPYQQTSQYQQGESYQQAGFYQQGSPYPQGGSYQQAGSYQQYQQPYGSNVQYSQYQKANNNADSNSFGIASMILGILSLVLFCTCINVPLAIAAVIFGVLQFGRGPQGKGMAITGIVTAALSVLALIATIILMWGPFMEYYQNAVSDLQQPGYDYEYDFDDDYDDFFDFFDGRDRF